MRLHEAGEHGAAARVKRQVGGHRHIADAGDAPFAHEHVAFENAFVRVHRDDDAAPDED